MGMRQDISAVGPQSLESPIPGITLDEATIQQATQLNQPPEAQVAHEPERLPASEEDEFAALETEEQEFAALEQLEENPAVEAIKNTLEQRGFTQKFMDRWKAGKALRPGGSKKRAIQILKERMPDAKITLSKKNNILVDGERFDPEEWELADFADWSGEMIETVLSVATEAGIVAGTSAAATPLAGALAIPPAAAAGATVGILGREKAMVEEGAEPLTEEERMSMIKTATLYNMVGLGIGFIGKGIIRAGKWAAKGFTESFPKRTIENLAVIHKGVDDVARRFGVPKDPKMAGEQVENVVSNLNKTLGNEVGLLKEELKAASKGKQFMPEDYLSGAREFLEDQRIQFDEKGMAEWVPGISKKLGSGEQGITALKKMTKQYNEINERIQIGKFDLDTLFDEAETAAKGVDWDMPPGGTRNKLNYEFTKLSTFLTSDKNKAAVEAAKGTRYEGIVMDTMKAFSSKADDLYEIKRLSQNKESQELLMKALVNTENSARLEKLKALLGGEHSKHWREFKSSWMAREIEKSIDAKTGIFKATEFLSRVSDAKLGKQTRKLMIDDLDYGKIRAAAQAYDNIGIEDVMGKRGEEATKTFISLLSPFRAARARAIAVLVKGKANAADYLLDRGFVEMAEKAASREAKMGFLEAKHWLAKIITNSKRVVSPSGRATYITTPVVRTMLSGAARTGQEKALGEIEAGLKE